MTHQPAIPQSSRYAYVVAEARRIARRAAANDRLDRDGAFPVAEIAAMHEGGLLHAPFPPAMGGCDLGSAPCPSDVLFEILATLGEGCLALGRLYEGHVNAVKLVRFYGTSENLTLLRSETAAGRLTGVWMAEDGHPLTAAAAAAAAAAAKAGTLILSGRKILASGAGHIQRPLVAASTDRGSLMILPAVPGAERCDLSGWTAMGMKATATGTVDFSDLAVAAHEQVGAPGDYLRSPFFKGGAWRVMAVQFGGLRALLESYRCQLVANARDRDRMQRSRFGAATAACETARLWIREAGRRAEDSADNAAEIDAYVDLMRGTFEDAVMTVMEAAQKSLGLKACLAPNPVERIVRDLTTYLRQPALDASREAAAAYAFCNSRGTLGE